MRILETGENVLQAKNRTSRLLVNTALLIYVAVQQVHLDTGSDRLDSLLLCLAYLLLTWIPDTWWTLPGQVAAVLAVCVLNAAVCLALRQFSWTTMYYFLIAFIATRIHGNKTGWGLMLVILMSDTLLSIYLLKSLGFGTIMYFLGMVGAYAGIRGARLRREAYELSQRHLHELQAAHRRLEEAHNDIQRAHQDLQKAHLELQDAAVQSLRYAILEERARIARDIHDSVGHGLTSIIIQLQALPYMLESDPEAVRTAVEQTLNVARQSLAEVRASVREIGGSDEGLGMAALKSLVSRAKARAGWT